jgi:serine/threonine-protein kinase
VPEGVDQAIRKALSPVAADRFAGAGQFVQALQPASSGATASSAASASPAPTRPSAPTAIPPSRAAAARPRIPIAALSLILGLLIGVGALFAWRHGKSDSSSSKERRIAVIPFENLGDTADAYFADGLTDAVRGKLTALPGMRVIASNSSRQYRGTDKSFQEIGRELGVDYLLVGKVRWAKSADGSSRVQVSPELIDVATSDAKWQQPFDASLTDVFKVQADVAGQVAQALNVAIGSQQQEVLADRPTSNLEAYDAYLKGLASRDIGTPALRQTLGLMEQAVALDSGFVAAWANLSEAASLIYAVLGPTPAMAERARSAADRAIALAPNRPEGYRALGTYYRLVPVAPARAVEQYAIGLKLTPDDADLLRGLGLAQQSKGEWEQALEHLRRSQSLDPRNAATARVLSNLLLWLRRYDEARAMSDQALALSPSALNGVETRVMIHLAQGDLAGAKAFTEQPPPKVDLPTFVAYLGTYYDLYWVLDADQRALLKRLRPTSFDGDVGNWGIVLAQTYWLEGDRRRAAAYADSARAAFEQQLTAVPDEPQRNVFLGLALAYSGHKDEAIRAGLKGVALGPVSADYQNNTYYSHQLARIYLLVGEPEKALDQLEPLLKMPYYLSPGWLKIDPTFDPLRKNPRFVRLVEGAN